MEGFIKLWIFIAWLNGHEIELYKPEKHICERYHTLKAKLTTRGRLELAMGCSKVNGRYVYTTYELNSVLTKYEVK